MEFPKKKNYGTPRIENLKYDRNFQLTNYLINTLLFVCNKQRSENRSAEAAIKIGVPREKLKSRENPWKKLWKSPVIGKVPCRPVNLRKVNSFTDILQEFC